MTAMKRTSAMLCILLAMMLTMTACQSTPVVQTSAPEPTAEPTTAATASPTAEPAATPEEVVDPMAKYDPPITLSTVIYLDAARVYPAGMTWDDNVWTRAYEEKMGIKLTYLWTVDSKQYEDKLNIAIAADDLPDVMKIPYSFFYKLASNGRLTDLTAAYDKYASENVKEYFNQSGGYAIKNCTVDGKLYGVSNPTGVTDNFQLLYIRDDWMKKLNISAPKNADDVMNIAKAFATQDPDGNGKADTVGLGMDNTIYDGGMSLAGFFNMYKAHPRIWIDKGGKLEYGSIQPEMKIALGKLVEMYNAGSLDKDFSIKGPWAEANADGTAGKIGMAFGVSWFQGWFPAEIALAAKDMNVFYNTYLIPAEDGTSALTTGTAALSTVTCASVDCQYPEAAVKLSNLATYLRSNEYGETVDFMYNSIREKDAEGQETSIGTHFFNYVGMDLGYSESGLEYGVLLADCMQKKDPTGLKGTGDYDKGLAYAAGEAYDGYMQYYMYGQAYVKTMEAYQNNLYVLDLFSGPQTETMSTNMASLKSKEVEIFTQIIMGAKPLDEFDTWVQYFNEQGGAQITTEVNQWYAATSGN